MHIQRNTLICQSRIKSPSKQIKLKSGEEVTLKWHGKIDTIDESRVFITLVI